jgi:hypothetical protein
MVLVNKNGNKPQKKRHLFQISLQDKKMETAAQQLATSIYFDPYFHFGILSSDHLRKNQNEFPAFWDLSLLITRN